MRTVTESFIRCALLIVPWLPSWISPAFLILWMPGGFRLTCYYYRKAYYRAFFLDPVGCAVGEPSMFCGVPRGHDYKGETRLLSFQNVHRYFMYIALVFLVLLFKDFIDSCIWPTASLTNSRSSMAITSSIG